MPQNNPETTLDTIREMTFGEMRHRIVRRRRDGSYWYVSQFRGNHGWVPCEVVNQNGTEAAARWLFAKQTQ